MPSTVYKRSALTSDTLKVAGVLEEAWAPEYTYIGVIVDMKTVQDLQVCIACCS